MPFGMPPGGRSWGTDVAPTPGTIVWTPPGGGMWQQDSIHLQGAQPRMFQALATEGFGNGFRAVAGEYGLPISHVQPAWVNDHCYGRMVPVGAPEPKPGRTSGAPPNTVLWLLARLHPELRRRARAAKRTLTEKRWLTDCGRWETELRPARLTESRALQAEAVEDLDDDALVDHLGRVGRHFVRGMTLHFDLTPVTDIPVGRLIVACREWGIEPGDALGLFAGTSPASRASASMLAAIAAACAEAGVDPHTLDDVRAAGPTAAQALDDYLADHGWRALSQYSPRARTLGEQPGLLVRAIRATGGKRPPTPDVDAVRSRVPDSARHRFDELLEDARRCYFVRDDNVALNFMWPAGLLRRSLLEAGRRLAIRGLLDEDSHVMALSEHEIASALAGDTTLRRAAAERAAHAQAAESDGAPVMLGDDEGRPPDATLFPRAMGELLAAILVSFEIEDDFVSFQQEPSTWTGRGVGIGVEAYTGQACVAADPEDGLDRLQPGDVLVTTHTTPAYEAVMAIAGAVVTESGGLVSHAAIVCREQGIPALLGVTAATSTIPDGATITVDPATGQVTVTTP